MRSKLLSIIVLAATLGLPPTWAQDSSPAEVLLQAAEQKEIVEGDLRAAIRIYEQVVNRKGAARAVVAKALLHIGSCYERLGSGEARKAYERVAQQFADQTVAAAEAHKRLSALESPARQSMNSAMLQHRLPFSPEAFYVQSDGKLVVYVDAESGDLVATEMAGTHRRILKRAGAGESILLPLLSTDSRKVAFTIDVGSHFNLGVMNTDGSGFHTILSGPEGTYQRPAGWTRDSTAVLVTEIKPNENRLLKVGESGGATQQLAVTGAAWIIRAVYSPDGKYIAYSLISSKGNGLEIMPTGGGEQEKLLIHSGSNSLIEWTPDGKSILFSSDRSGQPALYRQEMLAGRPQGSPTLIREGITAATLTADGSLIYRPQRGQVRVFVSKADFQTGRLSGPLQPVSELHPNGQWAPTWSPDGKTLAIQVHDVEFVSQAGPTEILLIPFSPGEPRRIATSDHIGGMAWASDGSSIYTAGPSRGEGNLITRISLDQGTVQQMVTVPHEVGLITLQMSDGGRALLAAVPGRTGSKLVRYDLETGKMAELVTQKGWGDFSVSPDGRWIAASQFDTQNGARSTLRIRAVEGGEWRELAHPQEFGAINQVAWTPDGKTIVYTLRKGSPAALSTGLYQVAFSGGPPRKMGELPGRVDIISIHPDGSRLAFSSYTGKAELWMLENFLSSNTRAR
jgi:Tol biopolymer transport system component